MMNPGQLNDDFVSPFSLLVLLWSGEHSDLVSYQERMRMFSLKEKRLQWEFIAAFQYLQGLLRDFWQRYGMHEEGVDALNWRGQG